MGAIEIPPGEEHPVPQPKPHVLMITIPAPGHMLPTIALGKFLARQGIKVTCLSSGVVPAGLRRDVEDEFDQMDMTLSSVLEDPVAEPEHPSKLTPWLQKLSPEEMVEHAEAVFNSLTPRPCCFISDVYIGWTSILAKKINLQRHFLITMSAASLAFMFSVPELCKQGLLPRDMSSDSRKLVVPGLQTIPDSDIWEYFIKGGPFQMDQMIMIMQSLTESMVNSTYLVNSCEELEPSIFEAIREPTPFRVESAKVLPIGPLETSFAVKDGERNEPNPLGPVALEMEQKLSSEVEQWLDNQPSGSVLYISFGSIFSLQAEQIREVAHALEASGQRFLWILRPPDTPHIIVSKQNFQDELTDLYPPGFEERTRDRGKLYSSWVMQPTVLAHRAVGLFMSHCGWNSLLEAVSTCTPIIACPCFVDQHMNARFVIDIFRIGLAAKNPEGEYERGHMESVIRNMMEGEEGRAARINVTKLNKVLRDAVTPPSGSSAMNLQQYVAEIFGMAKAQASLLAS